jgi:ElaB/YqjD/DUF883 family membrane-anchored ribosome-binding protein
LSIDGKAMSWIARGRPTILLSGWAVAQAMQRTAAFDVEGEEIYMSTKSNASGGSMTDRLSAAGDDLSKRVAEAGSKVSNMARAATDSIDDTRSTAADGLETAASTLRDRAESLPGGEPVSGFAYAAAERLSTTADYVRHHNLNRMVNDVETFVKSNPGPSLLAAATVGFLIGRAVTRE